MNTNYLQVDLIHCFTCHKDLVASAHPCIATALDECKQCMKAMNKKDYKFCPHCGKEI